MKNVEYLIKKYKLNIIEDKKERKEKNDILNQYLLNIFMGIFGEGI